MDSGKLLRMPDDGTALAQDEWLLQMMLTAWRVWYVHEYKAVRRIEISESDIEFTRWFVPADWRPSSGK